MVGKRRQAPKLDTSFNEMLKTADEPDRGRVLVLGSWLDDALDHYMRTRAIDDSRVIEQLFGPDRPLGTFFARINVAYAFAYISEDVYRDLHTIREIRNRFAHERRPLSFSDQSITDRCNNLRVIRNHGGEEQDRSGRIPGPSVAFVLASLAYIGFFIGRAEEWQHQTFGCGSEEEVIHTVIRNMLAKYWREVKQ